MTIMHSYGLMESASCHNSYSFAVFCRRQAETANSSYYRIRQGAQLTGDALP